MRKVLAHGLAVLLLFGMASAGWPGVLPGGIALAETHGAAQTESQPVPLILVHGLGGSGDAFDGPLSLGLAQRFERAGYVEGRTLFPFDYQADNNGDYAHVAAVHLAPFVDRVLATTGATRVDLLGYSMGGLVVRYVLNLPGEAARVRTAVLLASPAHGSFAADIVKDAVTTAAYLKARPSLGPAASWQDVGTANPGTAVPAAAPPGGTAADQQRYVFDRARQLFEPRLMAYLLEVRFGQRSRPLLGFIDWWQATRPKEKQALFDDAQKAAPGQDLTLAYLNGLALHAAETYVQERLAGGGTQARPVKSSHPLTGETKGGLVDQATAWLGIDARGLAIDRLLTEQFTLGPGGTGASFVANSFLRSWNGTDAVRRQASAPGPRYVVVAGTMPNLYAPWWPAVGPNDGAVEASAAWLPLEFSDSFRLFDGSPLTSSHPALKLNAAVFQSILAELAPEPPPARHLSPLIRRWWWRDAEWSEAGQVAITRWKPTYLEIDAGRLKGRSGRLTIEMEAGRDRWGILEKVLPKRRPALQEAPQVWIETVPEGDRSGFPEMTAPLEPMVLRHTGGRWVGSLTREDFGAVAKHIRVGIRLDGRSGDLPPDDSAIAAYRIRLDPTAPATGTAGEGPRQAAEPQAAEPRPAGVPPQAQAAQPKPAEPPQPAAGDLPAGPGTIWVRRWNRETTSLEPSSDGHAAWVWDFGDGTRARDDDPAHLKGETKHQFAAAGSYRVTATSLSQLGQVLRQQIWDVVPVAGEEQRFAFQTIQPPWLHLELVGPKKWMTGRPAAYHVQVESLPVPWVERQKITVDPAREFRVGWEKPGTYVVAASVKVETTYRLPEGGRITMRATYRVSQQVRAYSPVLAGS